MQLPSRLSPEGEFESLLAQVLEQERQRLREQTPTRNTSDEGSIQAGIDERREQDPSAGTKQPT